MKDIKTSSSSGFETQSDGFIVLQSKMNFNLEAKESFEVIESIATFHHDMFLEQIKDQMQYFGLTTRSLSVSMDISEFRLSALLSGNAKFEEEERRKIKNRLHF